VTDQPREPGDSVPLEVPQAEEPAEPSEPSWEQDVSGTPAPAATTPDRGKLYRSRDDRVIAGVCGGLGKHLDVDPVLIRVAAIVLVFAGGAGLLLYVIGWIAIPEEAKGDTGAAPTPPADEASERTGGALLLGLAFVVLGGFFLLDELLPDFLSWAFVWPVALIAVGLAILLRGTR
jgi:phage shock protein C